MSTTAATAPTTVDVRGRVQLPKNLIEVAGLARGAVVVSAGAAPGELIVSTPAAALARLQRRLRAALTLTGATGSLSDILARRTGRDPVPGDAPAGPGPATGGPGADPVVLAGTGEVLADTAVLTALLDAAPGHEVLIALLGRLQYTEAVADDLLATVRNAGLPVEPDPELGCDLTTITTTLAALGVTETTPAGDRAVVRMLEFELAEAGVPTLAERVTLAVAAARAVPALLARPVRLPDTVTVAAYCWQDLG